jgi:hypothetical protein
VKVAINGLNALRPKTFLNPTASTTLPSAAPLLRIGLEGNNRFETLFLGEPVPPAAGAKPATPGADVEYYGQIEGRPALFTVAVPAALVDKLRNAPEKLRETQILDFDRQAVTSIALTAPSGVPLVLQRLEAPANSADGAAWQVVRRGDGAQGLQTTPADRAAVKRLLDQLSQLSATAFTSDTPPAADLEKWGFNRPEREITLTLAGPVAPAPLPGANAPAAANTTLVLRLGTDAQRHVYARVGNEPNASVYAVEADLAAEFPVEPLAWRDRALPLIPSNARVTALKLTDLPARRVAFETTFDANGQPVAPARLGEAAQKLTKLLPAFRVKRFRPEPFGAEERPWKYQLDVTFVLPAGAAAEQTDTKTLFLGERQGGAEQLGGAKDLNLLFDLDQPFLDALFPLAEGQRDPGPPPETKK